MEKEVIVHEAVAYEVQEEVSESEAIVINKNTGAKFLASVEIVEGVKKIAKLKYQG